MKIAVGSQNRRTVTSHAGRTRNFSVWEVGAAGSEPAQVDWIELPKELVFHEFHGEGPHPLDAVGVLIVGGAGPGFVQRLAAREVTVVQTAGAGPQKAVRDCLAGTLAPAAPQEHGHAHHHGDEHHHGHGHHHGHEHHRGGEHQHGDQHGHEAEALLPQPQARAGEREK